MHEGSETRFHQLLSRRVTLLVGHFGSGKTELALNAALDLAATSDRVTLADLDVVKPYFRSREARRLLEPAGIEVIAPGGETAYADLPIILPRVRDVLRRSDRTVVVDVGGDDTGARVLGSLADVLPVESTECLLVLNFNRPFTRDAEEAVAMAREIEAVARVRATGLVANTHLMAETTAEMVVAGYREACRAAELLEVPVLAVTATAALAETLVPGSLDCPVVRLDRVVVPPFERTQQQPKTGPLFVLS